MKKTILTALLLTASLSTFAQSVISLKEQTIIGQVSFLVDNVFIEAYDEKTLATTFPDKFSKSRDRLLAHNADIDFEHLPKNEQEKLTSHCSDGEVCKVTGMFKLEKDNYTLVRIKKVETLLAEKY